jgi:hypothetical protein
MAELFATIFVEGVGTVAKWNRKRKERKRRRERHERNEENIRQRRRDAELRRDIAIVDALPGLRRDIESLINGLMPEGSPVLRRQNARNPLRSARSLSPLDIMDAVNLNEIEMDDIPVHFEKNEIHECTICLQNIDTDEVVTQCFHAFHHSCLNRWIAVKRECPTCRAAV